MAPERSDPRVGRGEDRVSSGADAVAAVLDCCIEQLLPPGEGRDSGGSQERRRSSGRLVQTQRPENLGRNGIESEFVEGPYAPGERIVGGVFGSFGEEHGKIEPSTVDVEFG